MSKEPIHLDVIEFLDDRSLFEEYQRTDREPGNRLVDGLLAEGMRRNF